LVDEEIIGGGAVSVLSFIQIEMQATSTYKKLIGSNAALKP
jgi:hypothetical protein